MSHKGYGRFVSKCLACGRALEGFNTKRFLLVNDHPIGYICYGQKICGNPRKRSLLIKVCRDFDKQFKDIGSSNDSGFIYHDLAGINGGKKQKWFNDNINYVVEKCRELGIEKACLFFQSKPQTLINVIKRSGRINVW